MLDRKEIIKKAYHDCLTEMYAKSQPPADYNQLLNDAKEGKIKKDELIYERHYLSKEEFKHIIDKYVDAYGMGKTWEPHFEILEEYLTEGGNKDKYVKAYTDEVGNYHPGHRGYDVVPPLWIQVKDILEEYVPKDKLKESTDKVINSVMETINNCKDFYRFDREESEFSASIALGCSPTSNPQTVIEYWKTQGVDVTIEERNPLLIWEQDYYGDDFEDVMESDYGENWKEYWDDKWKEQIAEQEEEKRKVEDFWNNFDKNKK